LSLQSFSFGEQFHFTVLNAQRTIKQASKQSLTMLYVKTANWLTITNSEWNRNKQEMMKSILPITFKSVSFLYLLLLSAFQTSNDEIDDSSYRKKLKSRGINNDNSH